MRIKLYHIVFFLALISCHIFAQDYWTRTEGPQGGEVSKFVELHDGTILAATGFSGMFRSSDEGQSWLPANSGSALSFMTDLAVASNGDVYAMGINIINSKYNLIHSSDNGLSWNEIAAPPVVIPNNYLFDVTKLALAPNGDIYVAGRILLGFYTSAGLYKSTDGGESWINLLDTGANGFSITDIEVSDAGNVFYSTYKSIFKSTDAGVSFNEVYNDRRIEQIFPASGSDIYARSAGNGRLFHSADEGETWNQVLKAKDENLFSLFVDKNGDIYSAGTSAKLFHSQDKGSNWTTYEGKIPDQQTYYALSRDGSTYFATSSGKHLFGYIAGSVNNDAAANVPSILISDGDLNTWTSSVYGFTASNVTRLFEYSDGTIFAAAHGNVVRSNDQGQTWDFSNLDNTMDVSAFMENKSNAHLFVSGFSHIHRSVDKGVTWTNVSDANMIWTIADMVSNTAGDLFAIQWGATAAGIYKSADDGDTWSLIKPDIVPYTIDITNSGDIFVGLRDNDILRSKDNGASWESTKNGLPANFVVHKFHATPGGRLIAVLQAAGFYISDDNGDNWTEMNSGISRGAFGGGNIEVMSLDNNSAGDLYAVVKYLTEEDKLVQPVMKLKSGSVTWATISKSGLNDGDRVNDILLASDDTAYLGTTSSIYKSQLPTAINEEPTGSLPGSLFLADNYPNPFNPSTTIRYSIDASGPVSLKIYDITGAEVAELVNRIQVKGAYEINFNAAGLSSGVYLYKLSSNGRELLKRMVLVK